MALEKRFCGVFWNENLTVAVQLFYGSHSCCKDHHPRRNPTTTQPSPLIFFRQRGKNAGFVVVLFFRRRLLYLLHEVCYLSVSHNRPESKTVSSLHTRWYCCCCVFILVHSYQASIDLFIVIFLSCTPEQKRLMLLPLLVPRISTAGHRLAIDRRFTKYRAYYGATTVSARGGGTKTILPTCFFLTNSSCARTISFKG